MELCTKNMRQNQKCKETSKSRGMLYDNFSLWMLIICFFRLEFWVNLESQMSHLNDFFPSWVALMCWANIALLDKISPHISHPNIFFSSFPDEIWVCNLVFFFKFNLMDFFTMISIFFIIWMTITQEINSVTDHQFNKYQMDKIFGCYENFHSTYYF